MHDDPHYGRPGSRPEHPRSEPEIIPPDETRGGRRGGYDADARVFVYVDREGRTRRVNIPAPGPFTVILMLLAVGLIAAALFAFLLGALFFLIPLAAVTFAALIAWLYARSLWYRLRGR